jgi:predicted dehydrogenase
MTLRVAVVGYGKLGTIHARLIDEHPGFSLVAVIDPLDKNRLAAAANLGVATYSDVEHVLDEVDCAIVATPTVFHHNVCATLLEKGKHVFVEKPITTTPAEARKLVDLAKENHLKLQVGHVVRFDHRFQAAEKLIQSPQLIECTRTSGYTFRSMDVGVTLDLMIHDLDLVLSLVDSPVESVQAIGTAVIGPHEDIAHARLTFSNGAIANLTASRVSFDQVRKLEATGRFGFVSVDFLKEDTITALSVGPELQSLDIDPTSMSPAQQQQISDSFFVDLLPKAELPVKPTNAIAEEHQDFYTAITEDRTPVVSGATGERVLNVAARIVNTIKAGSTNEPTEIGGPHFSQDGESFKELGIHRSSVRGL